MKKPPLSMLAATNAAWAQTGYGTQIRQLATRMLADGHHVAIAANYGLEATLTNWEGIEHFPRGFDPYSQDVLPAYFRDWSRQHPDDRPTIFTLYDAWIFNNPALDELPIVSWVPIDHLPCPEKVAAWCRKANVTPVAMSAYGGEQLARLDIEHVVIPHGIETKVFTPTASIKDATGADRSGRELMGVPEDAFVVTIANANKGTSPVRKAFAEQLLAFSYFAQGKDDVVCYLHTERSGGMGGIPFDPLLAATNLAEPQVKFVNQYLLRTGIPADALAAIYTASDVLLAATLGEGFGLTVAEAMACGTPAIVNDFTAQPEIVGEHGWKVPGQPLWDPAQNAWFNIPNVMGMADALQDAYERRGTADARAIRRHIVDTLDADKVYKTQWRPFLELL